MSSGITAKQLEANRQNAKKSNGPLNTDVTRFNALKHGILTREILLKDENKGEFQKLEALLKKELDPQSQLELIFVERIISAIWRLKRAYKAEKSGMDFALSGGLEDGQISYTDGRKIADKYSRDMVANCFTELILRYERQLERQIFQATKELKELKDSFRN